MSNATLAVRVRPDNPNHHLWNNHGTWWCHYTLHRSDFTKQRVRISLDTCNQREARARRDAILAGRSMNCDRQLSCRYSGGQGKDGRG